MIYIGIYIILCILGFIIISLLINYNNHNWEYLDIEQTPQSRFCGNGFIQFRKHMETGEIQGDYRTGTIMESPVWLTLDEEYDKDILDQIKELLSEH